MWAMMLKPFFFTKMIVPKFSLTLLASNVQFVPNTHIVVQLKSLSVGQISRHLSFAGKMRVLGPKFSVPYPDFKRNPLISGSCH